jgi:hypothetical protein
MHVDVRGDQLNNNESRAPAWHEVALVDTW